LTLPEGATYNFNTRSHRRFHCISCAVPETCIATN